MQYPGVTTRDFVSLPCTFSLATVSQYPLRVTFETSDADDDAALAQRIIDCAPVRDVAAESELCRRLGPRSAAKQARRSGIPLDLGPDVCVRVPLRRWSG
jgi:hypothetical protein